MKIVAILQNQWFKNPAKIKQMIAERELTYPNAREFYIKTFLFWGCLTGKRLQQNLGEDYCKEIIWEECSKEIGACASARFPADITHIQSVIDKHKPTHIIAFGQIAKDALMQIYAKRDFILLLAPHPAARQSGVIKQLKDLKELLDKEREYENANVC